MDDQFFSLHMLIEPELVVCECSTCDGWAQKLDNLAREENQ